MFAEVWSIEKIEGGTWAVTFAPDGKHLATGGADEKIQLRDATTGKVLRALLRP